MKFMTCNTCRQTVVINETGTCRACQKGFSQKLSEDSWQKNQDGISIDPIEEFFNQHDWREGEHFGPAPNPSIDT